MRDFVVDEQELEKVRERVAVSIILRESDLNELWNVVVSQFVGEGLRWHQNLDIVHLFTQFCPDCVPKVNHFLHELASSVPIGLLFVVNQFITNLLKVVLTLVNIVLKHDDPGVGKQRTIFLDLGFRLILLDELLPDVAAEVSQ